MKRYFIEKLEEWKKKPDRKPLVVRGARQVGKTYILKEFGKNFFSDFHYINFEKDKTVHEVFKNNLDPAHILKELSFYFKKSIHDSDLLIFDEIQECPRALTSLKYFVEESPQTCIASAGSLLGLQFQKESFPVGKVDFLELGPMNFAEFLEASGENEALLFIQNISHENFSEMVHQKLWSLLKDYFVVGGLPEVVKTFVREEKKDWEVFQKVREKQKALITAYVADMAKHAGKQNAMHLERLWLHVPEQLAKNQDGAAYKFRFRDVIPGIQGYERLSGTIDWLESAELIVRVKIANQAKLPLMAYSRENTFKLYFFDVGLLGAASNLAPETLLKADFGSYKGYFAENFVAQELKALGLAPLHSWKENTAELEFLLEARDLLCAIEVKSGSVTHAKSMGIFLKKYPEAKGVILSARYPFQIKNQGHLQKWPLYAAGFFHHEK